MESSSECVIEEQDHHRSSVAQHPGIASWVVLECSTDQMPASLDRTEEHVSEPGLRGREALVQDVGDDPVRLLVRTLQVGWTGDVRPPQRSKGRLPT